MAQKRAIAPTRTFTVLGLLISLFGISLVMLSNFSGNWKLEGWGITVANAMLYYLLFVAARAAATLFLSGLDHAYEEASAEPAYFPLVSIVVPCFNEEKVISAALESLLELNYPNFEVLVVDDGSLDMTTSIAKKFENHENLRVIYQENGGKAAALNRGISEAIGDFILTMDADSVLDKDVLLHAMPYFENEPNLAAVAGRVLVANSRSSVIASFQKLEYIVALNFQKKAQSFLKMVTIVPGPIGVFRKEAVLAVGGYDESTFAEDCELTIRLLMKGHYIKFSNRMIAHTEAPTTINSLLVQRYRWSRGMIQAISKNSSALSFRNFEARNFFIILYMVSETVLIPTINYAFAMLTITYALTHNSLQLFGPFFIGLTILDMCLSLYSITPEKKVLSLFFLSMINRFTYGFMLEIVRFFSIFDEMLKIPMRWGIIPRTGGLKVAK